MNFQVTYPTSGQAYNTAVGNAVVADETALGQSTTNTASFCDIKLTALTAPNAPTATFAAGGTSGSTSYTYFVVDIGNAGTAAPSASVTNTIGNTALSATNYMTVAWVGTVGHTYNLVRSVGGTTQGTIFTYTVPATLTAVNTTGANPITTVTSLPAQQTISFVDTGTVTATGNQPSANTTGSLSCPGMVTAAGAVSYGMSVQSISTTATTGVLTPANILNQLLVVSGGTVTALTMPTAVALVAALPGVLNSTGFTFTVRNSNSGSATLAVTTGVTSAAGNTLALISVNTRDYFVQFTNVTPGSEAYTFYTGPAAAY